MATTTTKKTTGNNTDSTATQNAGSGDTAVMGKNNNSLLEKMFLDMLKDMYWAEQHLLPNLEEMQKNATTEELQDAFEDHLLITKKHVSRLEKVFKLMGEEAKLKNVRLWKVLPKKQRPLWTRPRKVP